MARDTSAVTFSDSVISRHGLNCIFAEFRNILATFAKKLANISKLRLENVNGFQNGGSPSSAFSSGFSSYFLYLLRPGEWSAAQLPAKVSDGLSASAFLLAVQLPARVSDGLPSSVSLLLSFFAEQRYLRLFLHQGRDFVLRSSHL